ncbi:hypothetical protein LX81_02424 [Palleronia aestuarii]|uniref:Sulfotransferase family protein n=1 Tax=Palleronia aestuarii TaxID=568105 RepID=A0A2W7N6R5_9RHOB|nr:hypothetical protein [Palleronia aestuarii]PZX15791.1 hypothetical protein LX81_02424 [Palleronia aestuarii]
MSGATATFLLSTGRTSTQSLAAMLAAARPDAVVEHEPLHAEHHSRDVFRRPERFAARLDRTPAIEAKFAEIEAHLAAGRSYIDTGWPVYAWLPYLAKRLGPAFRFAHLVRNPYSVAASFLTHGFFAYDVPRGFQLKAAIHAGDPALAHPELAAEAERFTPYEHNLFHWLELNAFALECHALPGFAGLFRYETLYEGEVPALPALLESLGGPAARAAPPLHVDRHRQPLERGLRLRSAPLDRAVRDLAERLGYDPAGLARLADPEALSRNYSRAPG